MSLEDRAISDMLKSFGFTQKIIKNPMVDQANKEMNIDNYSKYMINSLILNARQEFNLICVNSFTSKRARVSFIVQDCQRLNEYLLFVKGEDTSFNGCFNIHKMGSKEFNQYKSMLSDYKMIGLKRIVLAQKVLTAEEVKEYLDVYNTICESSRDQLESFESHASKIETDLTFVGCIGIKATIREDGQLLTKDLREAKIQCNIISGDSLDNCLNVAKEIGITKASFSDTTTYRTLSFKSEQQGLMEMRRILDILYERIIDLGLEKVNYVMNQEKAEITKVPKSGVGKFFGEIFRSTSSKLKNKKEDEDDEDDHKDRKIVLRKMLLISGDSIPFIVSNPLLTGYFKTVLLFSNCIIGHNMEPSHKACLVRLVKSIGKRVLAIGDGYNDLAMFNESDVSIQLCNKDVQMALGDIQVGDLMAVRKLIFYHGANINRNIIIACMLMLWFTLNLAFVEVQFLATYLYSRTIMNTFETLSLIGIFSLALILYAIFDRPYTEKFLLTYPIIYFERKILRGKIAMIMILILATNVIEGIFLYYITGIFIGHCRAKNGSNYPSSLVSFLTALMILTLNLGRIYFMLSNKKKIHHIIAVVYAFLGLLYFFIELAAPTYSALDELYVSMLVDNPMIWGFVGYYLAGVMLCSWIIIVLWKNKYFNPISRQIGLNLKKRNMDYFKNGFNASVKSTVRKLVPNPLKKDLIQQIRKCFDKKIWGDSTVQKLLSIDYLDYSWPINWWHTLKDIGEKRKFLKVRPKSENKYWRSYLIGCLIFAIIQYVILLLVADFRGNYMVDSSVLYFIFICLMFLALTFSHLNNRAIIRMMNYLYTLFTMTNIVYLFIDTVLPYRSIHILASRLIMAPVNSNFLYCSFLSILNDMCFCIT